MFRHLGKTQRRKENLGNSKGFIGKLKHLGKSSVQKGSTIKCGHKRVKKLKIIQGFTRILQVHQISRILRTMRTFALFAKITKIKV